MKNVEIAEGGIGRRLSGTKFFLTDKPNSDQMEVWVDEDDRKLARLYATNNGTYYPEDYDAYGFSSVTVSIHGGVALPEMPKIEMPDGIEYPALIPEIEMPDGTLKPIDELFPEIAEDPLTDIGEVKMPDTVGEEGSATTGIDPEDGYTYMVDVDENGNLEVEKVPTGIQVIEPPDKTEYDLSEEIDPAGMRVALVDKDGNIVKTRENPTGIVEWSPDSEELTVPEGTAEEFAESNGATWSGKGDASGINAIMLAYTLSYHWYDTREWVGDRYEWVRHHGTFWTAGTPLGTYLDTWRDEQGKPQEAIIPASLGGGSGFAQLLVTSYDGGIWAMRTAGDNAYFDLTGYYSQGEHGNHGWSLAGGTTGRTEMNQWKRLVWEDNLTNIPVSTSQPSASVDEMKPTGTKVQATWKDYYSGKQFTSDFVIKFTD